MAGLAIIPFGAAAYWLSRPDDEDDADAQDMLPFDDGEAMADRASFQGASLHVDPTRLPVQGPVRLP